MNRTMSRTMSRFTCIAVALTAAALTTACTESVEYVRPIPIAPAEAPAPAAPASVSNRAPMIRSVAINPIEPGPGEALACIALASDPEGDPIEFAYRWQIDGTPAGQGDTLVGPFFRGARVTCSATPRDPGAIGAAVESAPFVVAPPKRAVARIALDAVGAGDAIALRCGIAGDPSRARIAWHVNEAPLVDAHAIELPSGRAKAGDRVRCRVELDGLVMESEERVIGGIDAFAHVTSLPTGP